MRVSIMASLLLLALVLPAIPAGAADRICLTGTDSLTGSTITFEFTSESERSYLQGNLNGTLKLTAGAAGEVTAVVDGAGMPGSQPDTVDITLSGMGVSGGYTVLVDFSLNLVHGADEDNPLVERGGFGGQASVRATGASGYSYVNYTGSLQRCE